MSDEADSPYASILQAAGFTPIASDKPAVTWHVNVSLIPSEEMIRAGANIIEKELLMLREDAEPIAAKVWQAMWQAAKKE